MESKLMSYKVYRFTNSDITTTLIKSKDNSITDYLFSVEVGSNDLELRKITLKESHFLKSYLIYKQQEYSKDMFIDDFILVELNSDDVEAEHQLKYMGGIVFNKQVFNYFMTTPNWMKFENSETKGKGAALFIKYDVHKFKDFYERFITADKLYKFKEKDSLDVNKIHARLSLGLSSAQETNLTPRFVIVPKCTYNIISDITTVINNKVVDITGETEDEELKKYRNIEVTEFDGCGVMSKEFAKAIQEDMGYKHPISWAGIRMYSIGVKGLVCSIDFREYFRTKYTHDTDFFRKNGDSFEIKDIYNEWVDIADIDLILNETQVKLYDNFDNMQDIQDSVNKGEFEKYKHLNQHLWVCKVNKPYHEINDYNLTNYQLIGNLALTPQALERLQKPTEEMYLRILDGDVDAVYLFLKQLINRNKNKYGADDEECAEDALNSYDIKCSTNAEELLYINPQFIQSGYVRRYVARLIKKKVALIAAGKFYVKNYYKTVIQDPISYLDWIMLRTDEHQFLDNTVGLKESQFYCTEVKDGEIRTCSRNPLASFSEIQNLSFVRNKWLDRWLGHLSKDLMVCNCYDLTKEIASGMDFDLDMMSVIDNEIIRDAVVCDIPFINVELENAKQNKAENIKMKWTNRDRVKAIIIPRGNLIGRLANMGASVSNVAIKCNYFMYKSKKSGKVYSYEQLKDVFDKFYSEGKGKSMFDKPLTDDEGNKIKDDKGKVVTVGSKKHFKILLAEDFDVLENSYFSEEELKAEIIDGLWKHREQSYRLRNIEMSAIDSVKTLIVPGPEEYKDLRKEFSMNPYFLQYQRSWEENQDRKYRYVPNALNINARRIKNGLLTERAKSTKVNDNKRLLQQYLINSDSYKNPSYDNCEEDVKNVYNYYLNGKNEIHSRYEKLISGAADDAQRDYFTDLKIKEYDRMDNILLLMAGEVIDKYNDYRLISTILANHCSELFIFNYFHTPVIDMLRETSANIQKYEYIPDDNGTVEFMFQRYRKEPVNLVLNEQEIQQQILDKAIKKADNDYILDGEKIEFNFIDCTRDEFIELASSGNKLKVMPKITKKYGTQAKLVLGDREIGFVKEMVKWDRRDILDFAGKEINYKIADKVKSDGLAINNRSAVLHLYYNPAA